ncbi:MAG: transcription antitermination factor NusB [Bacteroidetes bacterium]|nr:transcription antitermination factor NusB [Bacteroidota bacterium]
MLGRRHFRIKVFQALYGWFMGGESRIDVAEKYLLQSIEKIYELYFLQISFLLEIIHFYEFRMEEAKHKFYPTEEELKPSTKLLNNVILRQLIDNKEVQTRIDRHKISWTEEQEMVRKIYQKIKNSKDLKEYLDSGESSYKQDRDIIYKLVKKYITRSSELQSYCEERNMFWGDDYQVVALLFLKTLRLMNESFTADDSLPALFNDDEEEDDPAEIRQFILDLFMKTIHDSEKYEKLIDARTRNWELERIASTDIILIKMALTELIQFSNIPIKVTLNEYIEISKLFSTPKSKLFINGILDKLAEELQSEGTIEKRGRGLMT